MTRRERVRQSLVHRTPDKVPVDFGSTTVTGMHAICVAALRDYYGLERRPVKIIEPYQMLGEIEDDLANVLSVDVTGIYTRNTLFGFPNENWREYRFPWGQIALVPELFRTTEAPYGDILIYPGGDPSTPPSGRMPVGGFFFDTIIRQEPIEEDRLNPEDNLEEFTRVSQADLDYYEVVVKHAMASGKAVIANFGGTGFGDIALVPAPFLKHPKGIRDITEWYISTAARRNYVHAVFSRQCEIAVANLERIHAVVGEAVDCIFICGTDFGTQTSSFCSLATFEELYAPYYKRLNDWIHANTTWKTFKHSCGAIASFLPGLIDAGFDIINPVQCSAAGMDPLMLKERFGDRLVFWGGGVDTQRVLPFATPVEVRTHVLQRCEIFYKNGGFVFNSIHNVQANVPVENIVAMVEAVKEFNG